MKKTMILFLVLNGCMGHLYGGAREPVSKCHKRSKSCPIQTHMIKPYENEEQKPFFLVEKEPVFQSNKYLEKHCKKSVRESVVSCPEIAGVSYLLLLGQGCSCELSCLGALIAAFLSLK